MDIPFVFRYFPFWRGDFILWDKFPVGEWMDQRMHVFYLAFFNLACTLNLDRCCQKDF